MSVAAKLLINDESASFHALHVIFVRMLATAILGLLYMWWKSVPDAPFGDRRVRGLLLLRGASGFSGLLGLYYSLSYLPLSDATFISFIIPAITAIVCFVFLKVCFCFVFGVFFFVIYIYTSTHPLRWIGFASSVVAPADTVNKKKQEPMSKHETFAGVLAFTGVLLIARPTFLFGGSHASLDEDPAAAASASAASSVWGGYFSQSAPTPPAVTPTQRTLAIVGGVGGCFCAATSYATIRVIGRRAHSLVSVNYFAMVATVGSAVAILLHPDLEFVFPDRPRHWCVDSCFFSFFSFSCFFFKLGMRLERG